MTAPVLHASVQDLVRAIPHGQRLLGLDVGTKTIGVAISDPTHRLASPRETLQRGRKFAPIIASLRKLLVEESIGGLVVGLPVEMDGTEGAKCQSVRDLCGEMTKQLNIPAAFWDERLSTVAVEKFLIGEADMTRKRRGEVVDKMAASYILQGALDSLARD